MQWEKPENSLSGQTVTAGTEKTLDILCKVVDNYGDIGLAYRLSRTLLAEKPRLRIRLILNNLEAFHRLAPEVCPGKRVQRLGNITIVHWDYPWEDFFMNRPRGVIETFGCGFPAFYEKLLFDPLDTGAKKVVDLEF